jgi:AbrB family looped-hinge helix DNA binding protein
MYKIKILSQGKITLPAKLRKKYNWGTGKNFTLVDLDEGSILLVPKISKVTEHANKIAKLCKETNVTLEDLLETLEEERKILYQERYGNPNG